MMCFAYKGFSVIHFAPALALIQSEELISVFALIDKNLLLVVGSIRNVLLCVKNFLPQDVGYGADECAEGAW